MESLFVAAFNRLLQQNRHYSTDFAVRSNVRCWEYSGRDGDIAIRSFMTHFDRRGSGIAAAQITL
jgi:hypothetical protein